MKKILAVCLLLLLTFSLLPANPAKAEIVYEFPFFGFTHNAPNTGVMLPARFDPKITTYLLTVGAFVSDVRLTPQYGSPEIYQVFINGIAVGSLQEGPSIKIDNNTSTAIIEFKGPNVYRQYTVYIQRRPSEKRTRVSAGFIEPYWKRKDLRIKADLVNIKYSEGNISTYVDETNAIYDHVVDKNAILYYGTIDNPKRARTLDEFVANYNIGNSNLYRLIYIEDKIVAILPYNADGIK